MKPVSFIIWALLSTVVAKADGPLKLLPPPRQIPLPANFRVFFRPQQDLEAATIAAIDQATTEILVNQRAITSSSIGQALVKAFLIRKVAVAVIIDQNPQLKNYQGVDFLRTNNIPFLFADQITHNHQNYAVVDRRIVLTGYDWMASAAESNATMVVVDEPGIASAFLANWFEEAQKAQIPNPL